MRHRQKILLLTDWFIPAYKAGGPIQSCTNFASAMCGEYDIYVVTGDIDLGETEPYISIRNQWVNGLKPGISVYYLSGENRTYGQLKRLIREVSPDFIYLNHMFSPYFVLLPLLMWWLGQVKSLLVISPRGALFESALHYKNTFPKKIIVLTIIRWFKIYRKIRFHATTGDEARTIRKFFNTENIIIVNNLPPSVQLPFQIIDKKEDELKLIFIARIVPIKNLLLTLEVLKTVKGRINFTIIGPIEDADYWQKCQAVANELYPHILVDCRGPKLNSELGAILRGHHLFILLSHGENFGHSIVESFLNGRPVLVSDQTPWRGLEEKKIGWDVPLSDFAGLKRALETATQWNQAEFNEWAFHAWNFGAQLNSNGEEIKKYEILFS